jgi:xanthine dehydrogenase accessory factor
MAVLVLVKGAGDLATGVAHRLYRSGFRVLMTELAQPTVVRRTVSFAEAIYDGRQEVEGVVCRLASGLEEAGAVLERGEIPALIDPAAEIALQLRPQVVVDAIMAKRNCGTRITDAPVVIGLGPGFTAGSDVHAVVETNRGHDLGRVILQGAAEPNTGIPALTSGFAAERLVRSPADGVFACSLEIDARVQVGDVVGFVDGCPVPAPIAGVLRGLIRGGVRLCRGQKMGDVDPRGRVEYCYTISDKARAVGGGVLEAVLSFLSGCPLAGAARGSSFEDSPAGR